MNGGGPSSYPHLLRLLYLDLAELARAQRAEAYRFYGPFSSRLLQPVHNAYIKINEHWCMVYAVEGPPR